MDVTTPPRLEGDSSDTNIVVKVNRPVTLTCQAKANPEPQIAWFKVSKNVFLLHTDQAHMSGRVLSQERQPGDGAWLMRGRRRRQRLLSKPFITMLLQDISDSFMAFVFFSLAVHEASLGDNSL